MLADLLFAIGNCAVAIGIGRGPHIVALALMTIAKGGVAFVRSVNADRIRYVAQCKSTGSYEGNICHGEISRGSRRRGTRERCQPLRVPVGAAARRLVGFQYSLRREMRTRPETEDHGRGTGNVPPFTRDGGTQTGAQSCICNYRAIKPMRLGTPWRNNAKR